MAGLNVNLGLSVFKREMASLDEVEQSLKNNGWSRTGTMGGRVRAFENSGVSITAVKGPMATIIMPSGPIRGKFFSEDSVGINRLSVIGSDESTPSREERSKREKNKDEMQAKQKAEKMT